MMQFPPWKVAIIVGVLLWGALLALPNLLSNGFMGVQPKPLTDSDPQAVAEYNLQKSEADASWWPGLLPSSKVNLGLDLQGGVYLLMEIDPEEVAANRLEGIYADTVQELNGTGTSRNLIARTPTRTAERISFKLKDPSQLDDAARRLERHVNATVGTSANGPDMLDISKVGNDRLDIRISNSAKSVLAKDAVDRTIEIVRRRIDPDGISEISVQAQGDTRIVLEAPGEPDPARLKELLSQAGKLTFNLVVMSQTELEVAMRNGPPPGKRLLPSMEPERTGPFLLVEDAAIVDGADVASANRGVDPDDNSPAVNFTLSGQGKKRFSQATQRNIGRQFAIVLDDQVMSAPVIRVPIYGGDVQISGSFSIAEAEDLSAIIKAGALPAKIQFVEERTVGPTLGEDSIRAGTTASIIGLMLVAVFMIIAYGLLGTYAVLSLFVNIILILGALSGIGATLTLPGIAGIILTIGMAVDANVLVFERIREEKRAGRAPTTAVQAGYERALSTILDANITTFIAAMVLYAFGSGPVKGFAVTLGIGIITSVFTAFVVTRWITVMWLKAFKPKTLAV